MGALNGDLLKKAGTRVAWFDSDFHRLLHELRTPLNHINGFAELLLMDPELSPEHADHVRAILRGSDAVRTAVLGWLDSVEARTAGRNSGGEAA